MPFDGYAEFQLTETPGVPRWKNSRQKSGTRLGTSSTHVRSVFSWRSWHMSANGLETFDRSIHATNAWLKGISREIGAAEEIGAADRKLACARRRPSGLARSAPRRRRSAL